MIKLFRDYVFHQVNEIGVPVVDMAHVTSCLNKASTYVNKMNQDTNIHYNYKLDAGADEKILLTSRDDQTSIIVTYKELKSCITAAFNDIYTKTKQDKNK
jgi:PAB-dependent poly(A)-specific ribonuclease subunit 3